MTIVTVYEIIFILTKLDVSFCKGTFENHEEVLRTDWKKFN